MKHCTPLEKENILTKLKAISLFKNIKDRPEVLDFILETLESREVKKDEKIIGEGEAGDEMFILLEGEIEISKFTLEKESFTVAKLKDSMNIFFGELALVDEEKRSASVFAITDCKLLLLNRKRFLELGKKHNDIGFHLMMEIAGILSKRLRKANDDTVILFETLVHELAN